MRSPSCTLEANSEAELLGSEVGLHFDASGKLRSVLGAQFLTADALNTPLLSPMQALESAYSQLRSRPEFAGTLTLNLPERGLLARLSETVLKLISKGDGRSFTYAYILPALDSDRNNYRITLDAETEEILHLDPADLFGNCFQTEPRTNYAATAKRVRPEPADITTVRANGSPDRGGVAVLDYEGFSQAYSVYPSMSVLQEVSNDAFQCYPDNPPSRLSAYTVFPLKSTRFYEDFTEGGTTWRGFRAGDALYYTGETMAALSTMGLTGGWSRTGSDANTVVEYRNDAPLDNARFVQDDLDYQRAPKHSVAIYTPVNSYSGAAALDLMAHEWGHGVLRSRTTGIDFNIVNNEIEEGFADVIAHTVEKLRQPTLSIPPGKPVGYVPVESDQDWHMFEDQSFGEINCTTNWPVRTADCDDGPAGHSYFQGAGLTDDYLHAADDDTESDLYGHKRAVQLSVVFKLLSDGGYNRICYRAGTPPNTSFSGCNVSVSGLGFTKASEILFQAAAYYVPSTVQWVDLPAIANQVAFDLYQQCDSDPLANAAFEQNSVNKAFGAIGYGPAPLVRCR